ncbi:MAG: phage major capsid protein [Planctomycetota bacterium]|jgi:HK97 family phage major capsid protein
MKVTVTAENERELLQERAKLLDESRGIVDKVKNAKRHFTDEENRKLDKNMEDIREINDAFDKLPYISPFSPQAGASYIGPSLADAEYIGCGDGTVADHSWGPPSYRSPGKRGESGTAAQHGHSYRSLFGENLNTDGFKSFKEFVEAVASKRSHPALRSMVEGIPSDGGFLVPEQFAAEVFDIALESEIVRPRATIHPMISETKKIPATVIGDHSSNLFGGVTASWKTEEATMTGAEAKFRQMTLTANKLTCYGVTSNELLDDGLKIEETIGKTFTGALSWYLDRDFLKGDGAGKPLVVMNAASLITVGKEVGQAADTIEYQNLTKMLSRLHPASWRNSVWVCHTSTLPQLLGLSMPVGTGGSHYPVLNETSGNFRMLSRPVIFSEKGEPLGDVEDIMLCDFSQYAIGLRKEMRLESSIHAKFSTDQTSWRMIVRVDGQPLWNEVLTLEDGTNTVPPFVTLAARA